MIILFLFFHFAFAAPHALVLSGGDSPNYNHYSQYLQTKRLSEYLKSKIGNTNVDVFFGAGNSTETPNILSDVHRSRDGKAEMIFGFLEENKSAIQENIREYFHAVASENLKVNDTFFLLVGDHGMPQEGKDYADNCINLWNFDTKTLLPFEDKKSACLSVSELSQLLETNLAAKRKVFIMSQCFSGGFHRLSVRNDAGYPKANVNVCGFTATVENQIASGCTPDVDGPGYKGYERYFTQQFTGVDVVTGSPMPYEPALSPRDAHYRASLEDTTLDIPTSTSEYYLFTWGGQITNPGFRPRTQVLSKREVQKRWQDIASLQVERNELLHRSGRLRKFVEEKLRYLDDTVKILSEAAPDLRSLFGGSYQNLDTTYRELESKIEEIDEKLVFYDENLNLARYNFLIKPWLENLRNTELPELTPKERGFELDYFGRLEEVFRGSTETSDSIHRFGIYELVRKTMEAPDEAPLFSAYLSKRNQVILNWAKTSMDPEIRTNTETLERGYGEFEKAVEPLERLYLQKSYIKRITRLRMVIASAVLLNEMQDYIAIQDLEGLLACESTPL